MKRPRPYWRRERPETQPDHIKKFLLNPAAILATITALLYFHGQAIYSGYISYWGLTTQIFPMPVEETLTWGAWTYLLLGVDKWQYLAGLFLYIALVYLFVFLIAYRKPLSLIRNLVHTKRINDIQKLVISEAFDRLFLLLVVFCAIFTIYFVSSLAIQKGKSIAEADHKKIHSTAEVVKPFNTITVNYLGEHNSPFTVAGSLIQSSSNMYALHTEHDDVLLIPVSRLISIRHHGETEQVAKK